MANSSAGSEFDQSAGLKNGATPIGAPPPQATPRQTDEEMCLIGRLQRLEESAYEELIARYQHPVFSLVFRLMNDPADTADVVQEVFLKVFRNIGSFRHQSCLKTWIYRIAVNEAYNHRRWFSRHKKMEVGLETEEEGLVDLQSVLPDPGRSPFDTASDRETRALIETALGDLNPMFRAAVVLRDIEDLSYEEIADVLQISLGTVKSRILRGREALRKALAGRLQPQPAPMWPALHAATD